MKHLSIIIPVYNTAGYITSCLDSIYQQGIKEVDFEIIIVNDGSTDSSLQVITNIQSKHTNIIISTQPNQGLSIARNQGIKKAKGEYILFIDSDDMIIPNTLAHMLKCSKTHHTDMTGGKYIKLNNREMENFIPIETSFPAVTDNMIKNGERGFIENYNPLESYCVLYLYRKDFLLKNQLKFMEHKYFEDVAFTINCLLRAQRFLALPMLFYMYRQHSSSIMATINTTKLYSMNDVIANLCSLLNESYLNRECKTKLKYSIYTSLSVNLWYISHYKSLYPHHKEIIKDLKQKIPNVYFYNSYKQWLVYLCFKYIPSTFTSIRYYLSCNKY